MHIAAETERMLSEAIKLQKDYVRRVCSGCRFPCCSRVTYLFCEKDILFFKLTGRRHRWKREPSKTRGCRYLGPAGCVLDPKSRPFTCHRYICPDLEKEIKTQDPGLFLALAETLRDLDELRSRMWAEYLDGGMKSGVIQ